MWRLLLFLAIAIAATSGLVAVFSLLIWFDTGGLGEIALEFAVLTAGLLIASAIMMRWVERRPFATIGLPLGKEMWQGWLQGAVIGAAFMALVVVVQTVVGWLRPAPTPGP